jgi:hypothetical protein
MATIKTWRASLAAVIRRRSGRATVLGGVLLARRSAGSLSVLSTVACVLMPLGVVGCIYERLPDLHEAVWQSLSVEYLAVEEPNRRREVWSTTDRDLLNRLQKAFRVQKSGDLWGIGKMTSNRLELRLSTGRTFEMYLVSNTKLTVNEYPDPKTGFAVTVEPGFYSLLKATIEGDRKQTIHFFP